jgi:hypothetical protein
VSALRVAALAALQTGCPLSAVCAVEFAFGRQPPVWIAVLGPAMVAVGVCGNLLLDWAERRRKGGRP